jgi:hypothetical protein
MLLPPGLETLVVIVEATAKDFCEALREARLVCEVGIGEAGRHFEVEGVGG